MNMFVYRKVSAQKTVNMSVVLTNLEVMIIKIEKFDAFVIKLLYFAIVCN